MENKWLSIGVTPPNIAAMFPPPSSNSVKYTAKAKINGAMGGSKPKQLKDLSKDIEKIFAAYGFNEFTYHDIMALCEVTRSPASKLLSMIIERTKILNRKEPKRTSRGKEATIYSFKPNWKELYYDKL